MKTIDMKIKQQCDRNSLQESVAGRQDNRAGHFSGEQSSTHYHLILSLCLTIALLAMPANAVVNVLVGSTESHSIEIRPGLSTRRLPRRALCG